jgi:hypothetical protein
MALFFTDKVYRQKMSLFLRYQSAVERAYDKAIKDLQVEPEWIFPLPIGQHDSLRRGRIKRMCQSRRTECQDEYQNEDRSSMEIAGVFLHHYQLQVGRPSHRSEIVCSGVCPFVQQEHAR